MAGVLDALSRRVGRRPLRWFLGLWALLTAIWLLSGAIHFRSDRYADIPPVPEAVPYAAFLPGGARYRESFKFELDPQRLLFHDESRALPDHHFFVWPDEDGEFTRLVCWFLTLEGAYGWPRQWVRWSRGVAYDVSDPGRPVERAIPSSSPRESVNCGRRVDVELRRVAMDANARVVAVDRGGRRHDRHRALVLGRRAVPTPASPRMVRHLRLRPSGPRGRWRVSRVRR
ncbi:MAG: hypothetical protein ACYSW1_14265 [Planctomycetota bacterium]